MSSCKWHTLPAEMKLAIVDALNSDDVESFSKVDQRTYQACVPAKFRVVKLPTFQALEMFLENVPRNYLTHIEELDISTVDEPSAPTIPLRVRTDSVIALLSATPRLAKLTLRLAGSLDKSLIAPFPYLKNIRTLSVVNCCDEGQAPLSERLVVSIAASIQSLEELSLDSVSRSKVHASDLEGNPDIPLVVGDDDIPDHSLLGSELCLPSLLRIPTLRKLIIRETHLGDERWTTTPVACRLEVLDLGSYVHVNEDFNSMCTERIMSAVGPSVDEFSLATAVSDNLFAKPSITPLQRLRKLHITPFFPVDSVVDTVANLAGSPIETLSMQCFEEDVVDVCAALEEFLALRVERGPDFFDKLQRIDVTVAANQDVFSTSEETEERLSAARRLQNFCRDLRLSSVVGKISTGPSHVERPVVTSFTDAKRVKSRSMSI